MTGPMPERGTRLRPHVTGDRVIAAVIDLIPLLILLWLMSSLFGDSDTENGVQFELSGLPFILYLALVLAYYFYFESTSGATPGKRVMKLRVAAIDGELTTSRVAVRTLLRLVDFLPAFYLAGILVLAVTPRSQRLGDLAAGTVVVSTRDEKARALPEAEPEPRDCCRAGD